MFAPLSIPDVILVRPKRYADDRGWFSESYKLAKWDSQRFPAFVQDNEALSFAAGTVRGLHYQRASFAQAKLVRCVVGAIFDVAIDIRPTSNTFGHHVAVRLDASEGAQVFVPAGFAHGYCTLETNTLVQYKVSTPYAPEHEGGIRWNDPALAIDWPMKADDALVSIRDREFPEFAKAIL